MHEQLGEKFLISNKYNTNHITVSCTNFAFIKPLRYRIQGTILTFTLYCVSYYSKKYILKYNLLVQHILTGDLKIILVQLQEKKLGRGWFETLKHIPVGVPWR